MGMKKAPYAKSIRGLIIADKHFLIARYTKVDIAWPHAPNFNGVVNSLFLVNVHAQIGLVAQVIKRYLVDKLLGWQTIKVLVPPQVLQINIMAVLGAH
jgi:hypothetical protein